MSRALIAGGGLIGLLTARALRARGFTVTVVERTAIGREASWAGGGILTPLYPWRFPDAVTALSLRSQAAWPGLAAGLHECSGIDPEYRRDGMIALDGDDPEEVAAWAARHGVRVLAVERARVAEREPAVVLPPGAPWLLPDVASIRNPRLLRALAAAVVDAGVVLREGVAARRVAVAGDRAVGLDTDQGRLEADLVVICAGAWSATLVDGLGAAPPGIRPVRGQMLALAGRPGRLGHVLLAGGHYLIPRNDGTIVVGSTLEEAGFARAPTDAARAALLAFATGVMPELASAELVGHWAGLRPGSDDGVPTIDAHPALAGLWINAGHYRNGIVTAPASAELAAALISGDEAPLDPAPYAWPAA